MTNNINKIDLGNVRGKQGEKGKTGVGIASISTEPVSSTSTTDTFRIFYTDENTVDITFPRKVYPTTNNIDNVCDNCNDAYNTLPTVKATKLLKNYLLSEINKKLNRGIPIPPSDDLDDYINEGFFYAFKDVAQQINNSPLLNEGFYLLVEKMDSNHVKQTWTRYYTDDDLDDNDIVLRTFIRTSYLNDDDERVWSNWQEIQFFDYGYEYVEGSSENGYEWTGTCNHIDSLQTGTVIYYLVSDNNGTDNEVQLNLTLRDGGETGYQSVYWDYGEHRTIIPTPNGTSYVTEMSGDKVTTEFGEGSILCLIYDETLDDDDGGWRVVTAQARPNIEDSVIRMNGSASAGHESTFARADHIHPSDTSRANKVHTHKTSEITETEALPVLGTNANANQHQINQAIDTYFDDINTTIENQDAIIVRSDVTSNSDNVVKSSGIYNFVEEKTTGLLYGGNNLCSGEPNSNVNGTVGTDGKVHEVVDNEVFHNEPVYRINNSSFTYNSEKYSNFYYFITPDNFTYDDIFTLSFYVKGTSGKIIKSYFYNSGNVSGVGVTRLRTNSTVTQSVNQGDGLTEFELTGEWQHYYVTYQIKNTSQALVKKTVCLRVWGGTDCYISNMQIERGSNAHDYRKNKEYHNGTGLSLTNNTFSVNYGTTNDTACKGNDARLSDARNPKVNYRDSGNTDLDLELNNYITQTGFYYFYNNNGIHNVGNTPDGLGNKAFYLLVERNSDNYVKQTLTKYIDGTTWIRVKDTISGTAKWSDWQEICWADHKHGYLSSDGKLTASIEYNGETIEYSVANAIVTTDSNGYIIPSEKIGITQVTDLQSTLNNKVDTTDSRLTNARTPLSHKHGQIQNTGAITDNAVTIASDDNIVITDTSDNNKIKRVSNLLTSQVKDNTAYTNIGSSSDSTQSSINSNINTKLGNKQDKSGLSWKRIPYGNGTNQFGKYSILTAFYNDYFVMIDFNYEENIGATSSFENLYNQISDMGYGHFTLPIDYRPKHNTNALIGNGVEIYVYSGEPSINSTLHKSSIRYRMLGNSADSVPMRGYVIYPRKNSYDYTNTPSGLGL